jgi:hypothetical protein
VTSVSLRLAGIVAGSLLAVGAAALPAAAAVHPARPGVGIDCESGGSYQFYCDLSISGTVSTPSISWTFYGNAEPAYANEADTGLVGCSPRTLVPVTVTVTDASGSTTLNDLFSCLDRPWP